MWPQVVYVLVLILINVTTAQEVFHQCIKTQPNLGLMTCAGRQALSSLSTIQDSDNFTIDPGFIMVRDETIASREIPSFLDADPMDFRGMLENAGAVVGQRTLQWDLGILQPGLCLRVGPSVESSSMLEFIMDPNHDRGDRYISEEPSTARVLASKFLVPFLLGIKFNLLTILPLFFGAIILLCKKAAFLGKIALFVSGLVGYGSAISLGGLAGYSGYGGYGGYGGVGGFPGNGGLGSFARPPNHFNDLEVNVHQGYGSSGPGYLKSDTKRRQEKQLGANGNAATPAVSSPAQEEFLHDHFYEFEKKVLLQDRHRNGFEEPVATEGYRTFVWKT